MSLAVDPARHLADLHDLRTIGALTRDGRMGVRRRAFEAADVEARLWLADRMADAGLAPTIDGAGNVWGLGGPVLIGSHTDTQPEGGWLDGAWGVACGLECARAGLPVSVVSFQDEEGRFGATTGSEIWSGALSLAEADALTDLDGTPFAEARRALPATGEAPAADRFTHYLEPHIEQGPVLDAAREAVGVVTAIVGLRQVTVTLTGDQNHAGTTPMRLRRDALSGLVRAKAAIDAALAPLVTPDSVWTVGHVALHPNAASAVPGRARFTVQWRDAAAARLDAMEAAVRAALDEARGDLALEVSGTAALPPTTMDAGLVGALSAAAARHAPDRWRRMPSGALHDATNVARVLPVGMLFAPSIGGISHDFAEDTAAADLRLGLEVLADAVARLA
ncbi:hydantoinase/carbamoylase family amidase [Jannaschia sp. Os4]|uniref:hydantoinase/carbamoylase family amidase n=1 Tax=Jannaschia sp. Os4 TaxID=2807617 RepID=UPI00193ABB39|nr:hydantoinase/carbamoylase family amidase [Jannaschia sp. Os4]MBM2575193.1 hydantoinase/carbamoylase family amidase [Jannaschia sp. Os4]